MALSKPVTNATSVYTIIGEELQCAICHERLHMPRMLLCMHSFCEDCLQRSVNVGVNGGKLQCALCRVKTTLPADGVTGLKTDFRANRMVEALNTQDRHKRKLAGTNHHCDVCIAGGDVPATRYCQDCRQLLCEQCANIHSKLNSIKDHHAVAITDLVSGNVKLRKICEEAKRCDTITKCSKHPDELLKLFCETCEEPVCALCAMFETCKSHVSAVQPLDDIIPKLCIELKLLVDRVENHQKYFEEFLVSIDGVAGKIENKRMEMAEKIQVAADDYIRHVKERQQELLKQNDTLLEVQLQKLREIQQKTQAMKVVACNSSGLAKQLIENDDVNAMDIAAVYGSLHKVMSESLSREPSESEDIISNIDSHTQKFDVQAVTSAPTNKPVAKIVRHSPTFVTAQMHCLKEPKYMIYTRDGQLIVLVQDSNTMKAALRFMQSRNRKFTQRDLSFDFENITSFGVLSDETFVLIVANKLYTICDGPCDISDNLPLGRQLCDLAVDGKDNIYVADSRLDEIHLVDSDGFRIKSISIPFTPSHIAVSFADPTKLAVAHTCQGAAKGVSLLSESGSVLRTISNYNNTDWLSAIMAFNDKHLYIMFVDVIGKTHVIAFTMEGEFLETVCVAHERYKHDIFAVSNSTMACTNRLGFGYTCRVILISPTSDC